MAVWSDEDASSYISFSENRKGLLMHLDSPDATQDLASFDGLSFGDVTIDDIDIA